MTKVSVLGTMSCQEGKNGEMEVVLKKMCDVAQSEEGCEVYSYHKDEENNYSFFALMSNQEAMSNHGKSPAMAECMQEIMPLISAPPQMTTCVPVAACGLDI